MLYLIPLYVGCLAVMLYNVFRLAKCYEEESRLPKDSYVVNVRNARIDINNKLYNLVIRSCVQDDGPVLVCCTGDAQSMALLTLVTCMYGISKVHVLTVNHHESNNLSNFMERVCTVNNLTYHNYNVTPCDSLLITQSTHARVNGIIKMVSAVNKCTVIFKAHTLENNSNRILNNMFSGQTFDDGIRCVSLNETGIVYPFIETSVKEIEDFIQEYDIPTDMCDTHTNYNLVQTKNCFNELDSYFSSLYSNWRTNVVNVSKVTTHILEQYNTNINTIVSTKCSTGQGTFVYNYNLTDTPYEIFCDVLNAICNYNHVECLDKSVLNDLYMQKTVDLPNWQVGSSYICYTSDEYLAAYNKFYDYVEHVVKFDTSKFSENCRLRVNFMNNNNNQEYVFETGYIVLGQAEMIQNMLDGYCFVNVSDNTIKILPLFQLN